MAKSQDAKKMVEETVKKYGRLDFAFNNAGVLLEGQDSEENGNEEIFDRTRRTNLCCQQTCSNWIETDMYRGFVKDEKSRAHFAGLHPIGRAAKLEAVAGAVIWLCSHSAFFVTGQTLLIDGGYTIQ